MRKKGKTYIVHLYFIVDWTSLLEQGSILHICFREYFNNRKCGLPRPHTALEIAYRPILLDLNYHQSLNETEVPRSPKSHQLLTPTQYPFPTQKSMPQFSPFDPRTGLHVYTIEL